MAAIEWMEQRMPRKAKPPAYTIHVEGLSTVNTPHTFKDDLGAGEITLAVPRKRVLTPQEYAQARSEAKRAEATRILRLSGILNKVKPHKVSNAKPGEQSIKLGTEFEIIPERKPWRRV